MFLIFSDFSGIFFSQLYMIYKLESFWPDFEMITSQHGARILKFPGNSFINEYLISKILLVLIFIFLSLFVHEILVWTLFRADFGLITSRRWVRTSIFFREWFHRGIIHLKVPFTFESHLPKNISTWNGNLDLFYPFWGWMSSSREVKNSKFWDSGFKKKYFTSNLPLLLTFIFLLSLVHVIQV